MIIADFRIKILYFLFNNKLIIIQNIFCSNFFFVQYFFFYFVTNFIKKMHLYRNLKSNHANNAFNELT